MLFHPSSNLFVPGLQPQFRRGRVSGGGGGAAWYDIVELAATTTSFRFNDNYAAFAITLPDGDLSEFRCGIRWGFSSGTVKAALYDNSLNLVSGASASIIVPAVDNNVVSQAITPVAISSGTYWIAAYCSTSQIEIGAITGQPVTDRAEYTLPYSSFPPSDINASGTGVTFRSALGVYLS